MAIEIKVQPELDQRAAYDVSEEIRRMYGDVSQKIGQTVNDNIGGGFEKAAKRATDASSAIVVAQAKLTEANAKVEASTAAIEKAEERLRATRANTPELLEDIAAQEERLATLRERHIALETRLTAATEAHAKARRNEASAIRDASRIYQDLTDKGNIAMRAMSGMSESLAGMSPLLPAIAAGAPVAAGALATLAQAGWLVPGALAAAGTAIGTFKLATQGVGDAIGDMGDPDKFAKDLQGLAPAAAQFVLEVQAIMPALQSIKTATQNSFFNGMGPMLQQLANAYIPTLQRALSGLGDAFNQAFGGAARELMNPTTMSALQGTFNNISAAFHNLAPALAPVVRAFGQIAEVGTSFMPQLATAATNAANSFAVFIQNASRTGELRNWINDGLTALQQLGTATATVGKGIAELEPLGKVVFPALVQLANDFKGACDGVTSAVDGISHAFDVVKNAATEMGNVVDPILNGIQDALWDITNPANAIANIFGMGVDPQSVTNPNYSSGGSFQNTAPGGGGNGPHGGRGDQLRAARSAGIPSIPTIPSGGWTVPTVAPTGSTKAAPTGHKDDPLYIAPAQTNSSATGAYSGQYGAALDNDLGASQGLPGIITNLTKMAGNLAAAPLLSLLGGISQMNPNEGSGLIGIAASTGMFGSRFRGGQTGTVPVQVQNWPGNGFGAGGMNSDADLLANVPAGKYQWGGTDLTKGLADCSSAVEDLVNIMDGEPTAGRSLSTANAADWLTSRGFQPGTGGPGDFRVAYSPSHMQATLPGGTPFSWGSNAAAANRGVGGLGAADPALPTKYYRPASGGGGGGGFMGIPFPQGKPPTFPGTPGVGAGAMAGATMKTPVKSTGSGAGLSVSGGALGAAEGAAAMGADMFAPGSGAAVQIAMQEINRGIQYGAQVAGILTSGAMETLGIHAGTLKDTQGWLPKIAGGIMGAKPQLPNSAGASAPAVKPDNQMNGKNGGGAKGEGNTGPLVANTFHVAGNADPDKIAAEQNRQMMSVQNTGRI